jgi:hypothetical protein
MPFPRSAVRDKGITDLLRPLASDGFSGATTDGLGHTGAAGGASMAWTGATWAVAGGKTTNTPTGTEQFANPSFEGTYVNGIAPNWSLNGDPGAIGAEEIVDVHSGLAAQKLDGSGGSGIAYIDSSNMALAKGQWILASVWFKTINGALGLNKAFGDYSSLLQLSGHPTLYTQYLAVVQVPETGNYLCRVVSYYFPGLVDDASIKILTLSTLFRSLTTNSTNVLVQAEVILVTGTQAGLVINLNSAASPANFVIAYHDGVNLHLDKCVAGVYTSLINTASAYGTGKVLKVIKKGTSYSLDYDGAQVGATQTISDTGIIGNTLHGLFSTYPTNSFDNFVIWAQ